jgi:hypothetical protein
MDDEALAAQQPADIDEALKYMKTTLEEFHAVHDRRAFFLRVYYIMTQQVYAAINGVGDFVGHPVFADPDWIRRLSGRFASRYFRALALTDDDSGGRAWMIANQVARRPRSTVLLNALLGINAHINYDLAQAIAENLDPAELDNPEVLLRRKFDHDQVNNLLDRALAPIQQALARDYEPALALGEHVLGGLEDRLADIGLRHYRERVWGDALTYAVMRTRSDGDAELVRAKLDWESFTLAKQVQGWKLMWYTERSLDLPWPWPGHDWSKITL